VSLFLHWSDERLAQATPGDRSAFAELYQRHVKCIYRYTLARLGSTADAQDITAQTFEAALRGIGQYRQTGSVAAWLTVIARNLVANHYRTRQIDLPLDDALDSPADDPPPDEIVSYRLRLESALAALAELPPDQAEAVQLRIFGELSTAETAAVMERSESAVKMLLHRALTAMRRRVNPHEQEVTSYER
jgi:RNA polymerase sigma-70 factor (ECF subfamily)